MHRIDLHIILENIHQSALAISWCLRLHSAFKSLKETSQLHLNTLKIHSRICCNLKASKEKGGEGNTTYQEGKGDFLTVYEGAIVKRGKKREGVGD